jgi:aldehyde:ferredoxin oxidoreductase
LNGYMGRLLVVDLTSGQIEDESLNEAYARAFIGGSGLAARYLYDLVAAEADPLGPANPLLFMAGPLTGTAAPACGRHVVCALSPATGLWGEANSGGRFGVQMRFAGYDGLIVKGRAAAPVYLSIVDGGAELREADHLWGQDTYRTQEAMEAELGVERPSVACIGPAGENRVAMAAVMNDEGRAAGRGGLGAVMGSKKLKAVAVQGRGKIPLADENAFRQVVRAAREELKEDFSVQIFRETGTAGGLDYQLLLGDVPIRYWTRGAFEGAEKLSGSAMAETILTGTGACYGCPIACWRRTEAREGKYKQMDIDGPEYETVAAFGSLLLVDDLEAVAYANHLCNAYGLDTISTGSTIAFAYYLFEQGSIGEKETDGLALRWGEIDPAIRLIGMMARQEGFGALLAQGSRAVGRHYGVEGLAVQVNGLEVAMHDPRALAGMALIYATSPRGACHNQGDMYFVELGRPVEELGITSGDRLAYEGKAPSVARVQDWRSLYNALIMCLFCNPSPQNVVDMLASATGWELDLAEAMRIGERIWNLKRAFNVRLGLTAAHDRLPKLLLEPLPDGGAAGNVPDLDLMLREYYDVRGWDPATGKPTPEKLEELGLGFVAQDLWETQGVGSRQ